MSPSSAISFIVPAYNVAPYLDACLQSLVDASEQGDEIVLIDDGSTDDTARLCRQWAARQPDLIKLVTQHNQGLSAARNNALAHASRSHVLFMDSDDVIVPAALQRARAVLAEHAPDIVLMDFRWWAPERQDERKRSPACSHPRNTLQTDREAFCQAMFSDLLLSACSRIFKRTLLDQLGPQVFPVGQAYEEIATVPRLTLRARSHYYLTEVLFDYRVRAGSITQSKTAAHCMDLAKGLAATIQELRPLGLAGETEIAANVAAAKLLMMAIRDCGLVPRRPAMLYENTLRLGLSALSLPVDRICAALDASPSRDDRKTAAHLRLASRAPRLFVVTRKLVYGIKRRKLQKQPATTPGVKP